MKMENLGKNLIKIGSVILLCCTLGCASLVDKGNDLYEQGLFQEAAEFFERALKKDPDDIEAKIGLANSRDKIIDRGLIEVRMLRLGANFEGAALKLESLLINQKLWNVKAKGPVAITQQEELRYAGKWLNNEVDVVASSPYADVFAWFQHAYQNIITNTQLSHLIASKKAGASKRALKMCSELSAVIKGQDYYLKTFAENYCRRWGISKTIKVDTVDRERFRSLKNINNVNMTQQGRMQLTNAVSQVLIDIQNGFKHSLWFSPKSKKALNIYVSGEASYEHKRRIVRREVTYNVAETVSSSNGDNTETRVVNRVKKHRYKAIEHTENLTLNILFNGTVHGEGLNHNLTGRNSNQSESHNERFKLAKLEPKSPELIDVHEFVKNEMRSSKKQVMSKLRELWQVRYCTLKPDHLSPLENTLRCGATDVKLTSVNNTFKQKFGINFEQMSQLQTMY